MTPTISSRSFSPQRQPAFNAGGAKPTMLRTDSQELLIDYKGVRKDGFYETNSRRSLIARRVELTQELSDHATRLRQRDTHLLTALQQRQFPRGAAGGHLYLNPPAAANVSAGVPLVGLDLEIYGLLGEATMRNVLFFVYRFGYVLQEIWKVDAATFRAHAVLMQTHAAFEPQMMIPVSRLVVTGSA